MRRGPGIFPLPLGFGGKKIEFGKFKEGKKISSTNTKFYFLRSNF